MIVCLIVSLDSQLYSIHRAVEASTGNCVVQTEKPLLSGGGKQIMFTVKSVIPDYDGQLYV